MRTTIIVSWLTLLSCGALLCGGCPTAATPEPAAPAVTPTPAEQATPSPPEGVTPASETATPATADAGIRGACPCDARGYLIDPDRSGTNVRAAPGGTVVGQLPLQTDPAFEVGVYVGITASRDRWLQIGEVEEVPAGTYAGQWVFGKLIGTSTRNYAGQDIPLHVEPDAGAATAGTLVGEQQVPILGCCRDWVYVAGTGSGGAAVEGWLAPRWQCPNAVTNCS